MAAEQPFFPRYGSGQLVATSATPATITIPAIDKQVLITITGTQPVYFRITNSDDSSVASTADAVLTTTTNRLLISKGEQTRMSLVSPGGAGQVHVITGDGNATM